MSKTYLVDGMSCGKCAASVEKSIKSVAPSAQVTVNLEAKTVTVAGCDDDKLIAQAVDDAGFTFNGPSA
ncbi:MAG: copper chaperone [Rhodospirillales bacterium]|nr:MAG: copper chaperone [Rhodospirillales bacterium]